MTPSQPIDVQSVIDNSRLRGFHWLLIVLGFFILAVDGFDTAAMGYIAPSLSQEWQIARQDLGPVLSAALLGLSFGALGAGPLSDRWGRKRMLVLSCLFFGLATLATALASSLTSLTIWRFLTGVGLGAAMPNAITLIAEYAPARCRSRVINTMYCGFPLGAAAGGAISSWLIPLWGWRSVLLLGAIVPLLLTVLLVIWLPESLKFLANRPDQESKMRRIMQRLTQAVIPAHSTFRLQETTAAPRSPVGLLFSAEYRRGTFMLWTTYFMGLVIYYVLLSWMPTLMQGLGFSMTQSATLTSLFTFGGTLGILLAGWMMDRYGAHKVVMVGFAITAALIVVMAREDHHIVMLGAAIFLVGITMNGAQSGMQTLAATFYPTQARATGIAWMQGVGRFGGVSGTLMAAHIMAMGWSVQSLLLSLCLPALVAAVAIMLKRRSPQALALESK
ncbi:aromatic acid/H+ symport family MFS transporter [Enterobacterales bacterium CwR94]|nr:aromatic acid/H+ symport family MFS transporter [Enterobacterales bacterium CwR94]